jgi:hypothetical protein
MVSHMILQFIVFVLFARVLTALSLWIVVRATRPVEQRRERARCDRAGTALGRTRTLSRGST